MSNKKGRTDRVSAMQFKSHFILNQNLTYIGKGICVALFDFYLFFSLIIGLNLMIYAALPDPVSTRNMVILYALLGLLHVFYELDHKIIRKTGHKLVFLKDLQTLTYILVKISLIINIVFIYLL